MASLHTQYLNLPDLRIAYNEAGVGPVLLLLHGNSLSKRTFTRYQLDYFTDYHTYALDSRGHGQSRSVDREYTILQYCQDVIHFCEAKGIQQASLVGFSDGGNIALLLAKNAPRLFPKIVAISPNYLVSGTEDTVLKIGTGLYTFLLGLKRLSLPLNKIIMRLDLMLKDIGVTKDELRSIQTSIKILYAEMEMVKHSHIREISSLIPNAELEMIRRCTHINILKQKRTVEAIREYLSRS